MVVAGVVSREDRAAPFGQQLAKSSWPYLRKLAGLAVLDLVTVVLPLAENCVFMLSITATAVAGAVGGRGDGGSCAFAEQQPRSATQQWSGSRAALDGVAAGRGKGGPMAIRPAGCSPRRWRWGVAILRCPKRGLQGGREAIFAGSQRIQNCICFSRWVGRRDAVIKYGARGILGPRRKLHARV